MGCLSFSCTGKKGAPLDCNGRFNTVRETKPRVYFLGKVVTFSKIDVRRSAIGEGRGVSFELRSAFPMKNHLRPPPTPPSPPYPFRTPHFGFRFPVRSPESHARGTEYAELCTEYDVLRTSFVARRARPWDEMGRGLSYIVRRTTYSKQRAVSPCVVR